MIVYKVRMKSLSPITGIPDSQTIFGLLCHMFLDKYGKEELEELLEDIKKNPHTLLVSSMFYENTLPMPKNIVISPLHTNDVEQTKKFKLLKKIKYISLEVYKAYIQSKEQFEQSFFEKLEKEYSIINNEIIAKKGELLDEIYMVEELKIRNKVASKEEEKKLFYEKVYYVNDKLYFNFYIDVDKKYEEKIKEILISMNHISIGGSKSIGLNLYNFSNIEKSDIKQNTPKLLISKSIGDSSIDYEKSFYDVQVLNNKFNNAQNTIYRKQTIVFVEGSCIETSNDTIGLLIEEINGLNVTYQYRIGFLI